jgi:hypothetical protein
MKSWMLVSLVGLSLLVAGSASAQTCPLNGTLSNKLVCVIPQVYGPFGFGTTTDPTQSVLFSGDHHQAHFSSDFLATFAPINEAVGIQASQLPLASPSSGITFVYNPSLKTFSPSTDESLGPILGDRAPTLGKRKLFVGFSYQYFNFGTIDGQNMSNIPTVLQHQPFPVPNPQHIPSCDNQTGLTSANGYAGDPCFVRDFIQTSNNIDLTIHQYTIYATYGITNRLDVSVAIPILNIQMAATSQATIIPNSAAPAAAGAPGDVWHSFNPTNPVLTSQCATQVPCLSAKFSDSSSAAGIGDVVLRGKYNFYKGERWAVAAGVDVRLPTGDALNFLGSGATGVKPFGIVSYTARISPHAVLGYEWNGDSTLAGTNIVPAPVGTTPADKGKLPNRFIYIVGADIRVVKRLTAAFDIYGQRLFNSPELFSQPYTGLGNCSGPTDPTGATCGTYTAGTTHPDIAQRTTDVNLTEASLGLKYRIAGRLVATGNVLLKLDSGGLRSTAIPLVGLSYTF